MASCAWYLRFFSHGIVIILTYICIFFHKLLILPGTITIMVVFFVVSASAATTQVEISQDANLRPLPGFRENQLMSIAQDARPANGRSPQEGMRKFQKVNEILSYYEFDATNLIAILQKVQDEYRYLPRDILTYISTAIGRSPSEVFGVATFYSQFSLEPKGKYEIRLCDGTACHVRRSIPVLQAIRQKLKLDTGEKTTADLMFSVETVSCLGACGLAPVVVINDVVHPQMTPESIVKVITKIEKMETENI